MNTASEHTTKSRGMLRTAGWLMLGLVAVTVAACSGALPTSAVTDTAVLHKYARGYAPADRGSNSGNGSNSGDGSNSGNGSNWQGPAVACADTGTISQRINWGNGGTLSLGGTTLTFPGRSLQNVTVTMVLLPGTASVQFFPEGLVFPVGAQPTLTINTDCIGDPTTSDIVYTDNSGLILQTNPSYHVDSHSVSAQIAHFSRYAVDW